MGKCFRGHHWHSITPGTYLSTHVEGLRENREVQEEKVASLISAISILYQLSRTEKEEGVTDVPFPFLHAQGRKKIQNMSETRRPQQLLPSSQLLVLLNIQTFCSCSQSVSTPRCLPLVSEVPSGRRSSVNSQFMWRHSLITKSMLETQKRPELPPRGQGSAEDY